MPGYGGRLASLIFKNDILGFLVGADQVFALFENGLNNSKCSLLIKVSVSDKQVHDACLPVIGFHAFVDRFCDVVP